MKFANINGRAAFVAEGQYVDIGFATGGRLPSSPDEIWRSWDEVAAWAANYKGDMAGSLDGVRFGSPVPMPRQVFAIGLNYLSHSTETGQPLPSEPMVFTKYPTCICGPDDPIQLTGETDDWEVELVVVIGREGHKIALGEAWNHVAGLTLGQDISNRAVQHAQKSRPQFNIGKSFPTYGPMGPIVATPDEFEDRDDISLSCSLNGCQMQAARTSELIFPVADLVTYLSSIVTLLPGDVIFSGTPWGVGGLMKPPVYMRSGDVLESRMDVVGTMTNVCLPVVGTA